MRVAVCFLLTFLPGLLAAATWNVVVMDQRRYVPISDVAAFYRMSESDVGGGGFHLTAPNRVIVGKSGGADVMINGVKYVTCFPLRSRGSTIFISAMDVSKIVEPVMRPGKIQGANKIHTIVLDAGHGGHDSGAVGPLGREKDYTLDVVLRARMLLLKAGYQVKLTRMSDVFIPLDERSAFANRFPDALFFSVHFNKSNTYGGTGIETYALAPRGVPSMDEESLRYSDFAQNPGNARDAENIALAAAVHSAMCRHLPVPDRGVKRARFAVIKNIRIPGVLIEGGFVDSSYDARLVAMAEYRQRIAQSILEAVLAYSRAVGGAAPPPSAEITVTPSQASPTPTPTAAATPAPGKTPETTKKPEASPTPNAVGKPGASPTPEATTKPAASPTLDATKTSAADKTPDASKKPEATPTPDATKKPAPDKTPETSKKPEASPTPDATKKPAADKTPDVSKKPEASPTPDATKKPVADKTPDALKKPEASPTPDATKKPTADKTPETSKKSKASPTPHRTAHSTKKPKASPTPDVDRKPATSRTHHSSKKPKATPTPSVGD